MHRLLIFCFILSGCYSINTPPRITNVPDVGTVPKYQSSDKCLFPLNVEDDDGDTHICGMETSTEIFNVTKRDSDTDFCVYFLYTGPDTLTLSSYTLDVICNDGNGGSDTGQVRIDVVNNQPPRPISSLTVTEVLDVSKLHGANIIIYTIGVTDDDDDELKFTSTPPPGITVGLTDGVIWTTEDLRKATEGSFSVSVDVSDGQNDPVTFVISFTLENMNSAPTIINLPDNIVIPEDEAAGSTLYTCSYIDNELDTVTATLSVDPVEYSGLFDLDSSSCILTVASGQSFDFEDKDSFTLTIDVTDNYLDNSYDIPVTITNKNEAPVFTIATLSTTEKEALANEMTITLDFDVYDPDVDDTLVISLGSGENSDMFTLTDGNPDATVITNVVDIDFEGGSLPNNPLRVPLVVTDSGGLTATGMILITITDDNDNDPVFAEDSYDFTVSSQTVGGTELGVVAATDIDSGNNGEVEFKLTSASHEGLFSVLSDGRIFLEAGIDPALQNTPFVLNVRAQDRGPPPGRSADVVVFINWNKSPIIENLPNVADCPEDPSEEYELLALSLSDPEGDEVSCTVSRVEPATNAFAVLKKDSKPLAVYYTGASDLDAETQASYVVYVLCVDGFGGSVEKTLTVTVTVNTPPSSSCEGPDSTTADVSTLGIGDDVYTLTVSDAEGDTVTITPSTTSQSFAFDQGANTIITTRDLMLEDNLLTDFTLTISDGVNDDITCIVTISLKNQNSAPVFASHESSISRPENTASMEALFTLDISDDQPVTVTWTVDPESDRGLFHFDNTKHEVSLASGQSFDYEKGTTTFVVTCHATDGYMVSSSSVEILILDSDEPPDIASDSYSVSIKEGPANARTISITYNLTDPDTPSGDTHTYTLVPSDHSKFFSINSATGVITNKDELERDNGADNPLEITVKVTDQTDLTDTAVIVITLTDINDNDPIFDPDNYNFKVGTPNVIGDFIGKIGVSDPDLDENGEVECILTDESPAGYFVVDTDGSIYLDSDLDLAYGTLISLDVSCNDFGDPQRTSRISLIIAWNEGPDIVNLPAVAYVHEDSEGEILKQLEIDDPENDLVECIVANIEPPTSAFDIDYDNDADSYKVIYVGTVPLSYEAVSTYTMTIDCYDNNGVSTKELTIHVRDNADPALPCKPSADVTIDASSTPVDTLVYDISATDPEGDALTYTVTFKPPTSVFEVGQFNGKITAAVDLKVETRNQFAVSVTVEDQENSNSCIINIFLTNVNKEPVFSNLPETATVDENTAGGTEVFVVSVTDSVLCSDSMGFDALSIDEDVFEIVPSGLTASVRVVSGAVLDHERKTRYSMTLRADDGCLQSDVESLTVYVRDVNEEPVFEGGTEYSISFREDRTRESFVLNCEGSDPDAGDSLSVSLSGDNADLFTVEDTSQCIITLIDEFDLDAGVGPNPSTLTLTLTDRQGLTTEATVVVSVEEVNDNAPEFRGPVHLKVNQGDPMSKEIGVVQARDIDSGINKVITYTLVKEDDAHSDHDEYITFTSTGSVILKKSMDDVYDTVQKFSFKVVATDHGTPALSSEVDVDVTYYPTTTPTTTSTTAATTDTTEKPDDDSPFTSSAWFIGMVSALAVLGVMCLFGLGYVIYRLCESSPENVNYDTNRSSRPGTAERSKTPVRPNRISVHMMNETSDATRKISRITPLRAPNY